MASSDYKKVNREIKGYVETLYNIKKYNNEYMYIFYETGEKMPKITNEECTQSISQIFNTNRVVDNFAILSENYTKLDGSFVLFNRKNTNDCGFYSSENVSYYTELGYNDTPVGLFIGSSSSPIIADTNGITIYTKNNNIISCKVSLRSATGELITSKEIVDNGNSCIIIDFQTNIKGNYIIIENIKFEYEDRRITISHIDFGLSYIYKDEELIEFTVTEQVDKLVEETPANELNLKIGDYNKLYDPLNPKGITAYLTEKSEFIPYIGIINEENNVEYTKMGEFFFNSIDYQDKQVTITAYNLMNELSKVMIKNTNGSLAGASYSIFANTLRERLEKFLSSCYKYDYDINISNTLLMMILQLPYESLASFLQQAAMLDGLFYVDRDNKIIIREVDKKIIETLSKSELLQDINYINVKNYKSYYFNLLKIANFNGTSILNSKDNFSITFTLKSDEDEIVVTSNDPGDLADISTSDLTYSGAESVKVLGYSQDVYDDTKHTDTNQFIYMLFLKVTGVPGTIVTISGKREYKIEFSNKAINPLLMGNDEATDIIIDNPLVYSSNVSQKFIDKMYGYKVSLDYNGDPFIKAGYYIEAESNYGYIPLFVTKHILKYNGGLSGSIEGVE